jgi:DNA replication and repair protein RecF
MTLERLRVDNFRCIQAADLAFDHERNLISGANASGKTSLLESIYFLGRARSFRTARTDALIRSGAERLTVSADLLRPNRQSVLGLGYGATGLEVRMDGRPLAGVAELAAIFPVQAIDPELHRLVEEGPQQRRRFLDWGVFHVEPNFVPSWQRFQRALRQRNAALRARAGHAVIRAWDAEIVETGGCVAAARARYLDALQPEVREVGERLLGQPVTLQLTQGWSAEQGLEDALERAWPRDLEHGLTHVGPHRADLHIRVDGHRARERVSRGQQKLVAAAMLLGQLRCDAALGSPTAALLVDDPAAELDSGAFQRLLDEILALPLQLFITAIDVRNPVLERFSGAARFHVEHGNLTRLL